ncbi:MAG: hypothetical protein ACMG50_02815, partial [Thermomonas sp.]
EATPAPESTPMTVVPAPMAPVPVAPVPMKPAAIKPAIVAAQPAVKAAVPVKTAAAAKPAPMVVEAPVAIEAGVGMIAGTLKLSAGAGQSVSAGEVSEGLVYFLPKAGSPKPKPGHFKINTRSKGFIPETLVVPQGSTVAFPNIDTIIHNVYSRSPGNSFDLGYYGPGKSPEFTFNTAGLTIVNCTVHHTMRANVVVLATPYYTRPGKDGRYLIKDVPPGPGTLVFWHPRAVAKSVQASAPMNGANTQTLIASKSPQMH